jgi:hypothetical protein
MKATIPPTEAETNYAIKVVGSETTGLRESRIIWELPVGARTFTRLRSELKKADVAAACLKVRWKFDTVLGMRNLVSSV